MGSRREVQDRIRAPDRTRGVGRRPAHGPLDRATVTWDRYYGRTGTGTTAVTAPSFDRIPLVPTIRTFPLASSSPRGSGAQAAQSGAPGSPDQPPAARPPGTRARPPVRKRRTKWERRLGSPKIPWVAGALVLVALTWALVWRHRAAGRPEYAVNEIAAAIEHGDGTKLAYYADASAFTDQVVNETVDWLTARRGLDQAVAGAESQQRGSRSARLQDAKETLSDRLGRATSAALESPDGGKEPVSARVVDAFISQPPLSVIMDGDHLDVRSIDRPLIEGTTATVPVTLRYRELVVDMKIGLVLQRNGLRWRLVGVSGLQSALSTIDNAQLERVAIANRPRESDLERLVAVGPPQVQRVKPRRARPLYRLEVSLTNQAQASITEVSLLLGARGLDDDHGIALSVEHPIPPSTTSAETWEFDEAATRGTRLGALLTHADRLTLRTRGIVLDTAGQADTVRLIKSYREIQKDGD